MIRSKQILQDNSPQGHRSLIIDQGFRMIGIELSDIDHLSKLPPLHPDPFDRMLIAQALRRNFTLATKDSVIASYGTLTLW